MAQAVPIEPRSQVVGDAHEVQRVVRVGRVPVPRVEIERRVRLRDVLHERIPIRRRIVRPGDRRTADPGFWVGLLHGPRHLRVQREVLPVSARPEHLAEIRLVPDFPVADTKVIAVGPAAVVVQHDVLGDARVAIEVARWCRVCPFAASESKDRLSAHRDNRRDELVRRAEAIARRILGVGIRVGEQGIHVALRRDQRAARRLVRLEPGIDVSGTVCVMRANQIDVREAVAARGVDRFGHVPAPEREFLRLVHPGGRRSVDTRQ